MNFSIPTKLRDFFNSPFHRILTKSDILLIYPASLRTALLTSVLIETSCSRAATLMITYLSIHLSALLNHLALGILITTGVCPHSKNGLTDFPLLAF
ncbi:hypothetical protein IJL65_00555 [bacterium]|nr:hypothetical protein [bacterium]